MQFPLVACPSHACSPFCTASVAATVAAAPAQSENLENNQDPSSPSSTAGQVRVLMQVYQRFCLDRRVFPDMEPVHNGAIWAPTNVHLARPFQLLPQFPGG